MKPRTQIGVSLLALGCLLGSAVSSYATNIAELPLKASVLAKPNVIFGLDDSWSMDSEVMINTNDGAFWWDYNAASVEEFLARDPPLMAARPGLHPTNGPWRALREVLLRLGAPHPAGFVFDMLRGYP